MPVYDTKGQRKAELTVNFPKSVRADIIKRAVLAEQSVLRQPYSTDINAGFRTSAHYIGERGVKNTMMMREMARLPRIVAGGYMHFTARRVPQATKGREAHPPRIEKIWKKKVNRKEHILAMSSALAATASREFVSSRGHLVGKLEVPIVIEDLAGEITKSKAAFAMLKAIGLGPEIERAKQRKSAQAGGQCAQGSTGKSQARCLSLQSQRPSQGL